MCMRRGGNGISKRLVVAICMFDSRLKMSPKNFFATKKRKKLAGDLKFEMKLGGGRRFQFVRWKMEG